MNVLIINLDKGLFGKEPDKLERLKDYSRLVDKIFVISWTLKKEEPIFWEGKLFIYPTNSKSRLFYIFDTCRIFKKYLSGEKIDVVSCQDPFEIGLAGRWLAKKFGIPLHLQVHTDFLSPYFKKESLLNRFRVWLAKSLIPKADGIRVVSQRIKKQLIEKLGTKEEKIMVVPIYADIK